MAAIMTQNANNQKKAYIHVILDGQEKNGEVLYSKELKNIKKRQRNFLATLIIMISLGSWQLTWKSKRNIKSRITKTKLTYKNTVFGQRLAIAHRQTSTPPPKN